MTGEMRTLFASINGQTGVLLGLLVLGSLSYIVQSLYALVALHQPWEPLSYATGFAALLGGGATGLGAHIMMRAGRNALTLGGSPDASSSQ